jgi:hypothetical protein
MEPIDNTDELIAALELQDLEDATHLPVKEFALLVGESPQLIHYYVRTGVLTKEPCQCGRPVLEVRTSLKALSAHKEKQPGRVRSEPDEPTKA